MKNYKLVKKEFGCNFYNSTEKIKDDFIDSTFVVLFLKYVVYTVVAMDIFLFTYVIIKIMS